MRGLLSRRKRPTATHEHRQPAPGLETASAGPEWPARNSVKRPAADGAGHTSAPSAIGSQTGARLAGRRGSPLTRRGCLSLTAIFIHAVIAFISLLFLFVVNVVTLAQPLWIQWVAWAWSMVFAVHLGASVTHRRLLGAHIGLFLALSLGLIGMDIADRGDVWSPWAVMGVAITVLVHAGISFVHHPPKVLDEAAPVQPAIEAAGTIGQVAPVTVPRPTAERTGISFGMKVISITLGAFALGSVLVAVWMGVQEASRLQGSGVAAVETIPVAEFDRVEVAGTAEVTVRSGPVAHLTVTGDDNLVPLVEAHVSNGRLRIALPVSAGQDIRYEVPLHYDIVVPNLTELRLRGETSTRVELDGEVSGLSIFTQETASVTVVDLVAQELSVTARGASSVALSGTATDLQVSALDIASVRALDLTARQVRVEVRQAAYATVTATETLEGRIADAGSVEYGGEPTVDVQVSDAATLAPFGGVGEPGTPTAREPLVVPPRTPAVLPTGLQLRKGMAPHGVRH